jgi:phenylalanyl-tRNA synthetase beta chain
MLDANDLSKIFHPYRFVAISTGREQIGIFGELHPQIRQKYKITKRVWCFELDFEKINQLSVISYQLSIPEKKTVIYKPFSKFPPSVRDLSVIVNEVINSQDIIEQIKNMDSLIVNAELFDEYRGKGIPEGKKSLAFHITYQSFDRTLTDEEVNEIHQKVIDILKEKFSAVPRI